MPPQLSSDQHPALLLAQTEAEATASDPWGAVQSESATPADAAQSSAPNVDSSVPSADSAWDQAGASSETPAADWLSAAPVESADPGLHLSSLWDGSLPVQHWINQGLDWFVSNFRPFFQAVRGPIDSTLTGVQGLLQSVPTLAMILCIGLLAWQLAGASMALGSVLALLVVAMLGIWSDAMVTLSLVLTSLAFCLLIGLPLGILLAASERAQRIVRPLLDAMQTTPAFVYLVPVVMLFGIGNVPGVIVTIVFALAPLVRLTALGIRQVRPDLIEATRAYGASPWQLLVKVQIPLAMPSIMTGINQSLMLSLSMVVIASMIAVGGLGQMVLRGIGRLDMGLATVGGLGIVLLAITLDRITQAMGQPRRGVRHWYQSGPAGLLYKLFWRRPAAKADAGSRPIEDAPALPAR
jgi:glycine betaine/proline transport system permease protein